MVNLKLQQFEGPLDLLLQLVEQEKLPISEVSLSAVTEQYLAYVEAQTDLPPEELADFLVVAAKLLLIKSRLLLPNLFAQADEPEEENLARQLAIFKAYVEAGKFVNARLLSRQCLYPREKALVTETATFSPPTNATTEAMHKSFTALLEDIARYVKPAPQLLKRTISLREKIGTLRSFLSSAGKVSFHSVLQQASNRTEVIVTFLALLELIKSRHVVAWQEGHSTAIMVAEVEAGEFVEPQELTAEIVIEESAA